MLFQNRLLMRAALIRAATARERCLWDENTSRGRGTSARLRSPGEPLTIAPECCWMEVNNNRSNHGQATVDQPQKLHPGLRRRRPLKFRTKSRRLGSGSCCDFSGWRLALRRKGRRRCTEAAVRRWRVLAYRTAALRFEALLAGLGRGLLGGCLDLPAAIFRWAVNSATGASFCSSME